MKRISSALAIRQCYNDTLTVAILNILLLICSDFTFAILQREEAETQRDEILAQLQEQTAAHASATATAEQKEQQQQSAAANEELVNKLQTQLQQLETEAQHLRTALTAADR